MKRILTFISGFALFGLLAMSAFSAEASLYNASRQDAQQADAPAGTYWDDSRQGWFWYKDPAIQQPQKKEAPKTVKKRKTIYEMTSVKEIRQEVQRLMDKAIMNPTEANMKEFLKANQYVMNKGSTFSDEWRRTVWKNPDLDYSLRRPVNSTAINSYNLQQTALQNNNIANLSQKYGLFFFFRSNCPYCHALSPTLRYFQQHYGMEIFPISLDGGGLPEFPNPHMDNGMAAKLNITTVPAVYLGDKQDRSLAPISFGVISLSELVERIYTLTQTTPGSSY